MTEQPQHQALPAAADLRQRMRSLEVENRRLMANQGQLVADTNRTVEVGE